MSKAAWFSSSHEDCERWDGPFGSREEAEDMAADFDDGGFIAEGRMVNPVDWIPSGEEILEQIEQRAYDNGEGCPDDQTFEASSAALEELEKLMAEWARQNVTANWYIVDGEHIRVEPAAKRG